VALAVDVRKTARDELYSSHEAVAGLGASVALAVDVCKTARDDLYSSHEAITGLGASVALAVDVRKTARDDLYSSHEAVAGLGVLLQMTVTDLQPFSTVDNNGFREFVHGLDPSYIIPSRTTSN